MHWWTSAPAEARRALIAAGLGWMLDAFDVMIYALVLAALITDLGLDKAVAGQLGSLTLLASAAGGMLFGLVADSYGRTRALMASILLYSVFTAACGLAQNVAQLAVFRVFLGLGMGGEWASGAALVSETWPDEHRGKALGLMQSAWAIGYAAAAIVTAIVLPVWGWRAVFFVGILPAFFTLWVRRKVEEPRLWRERRDQSMTGLSPEAEDLGPTKMIGRKDLGPTKMVGPAAIFRAPLLGLTIALTLMNACTMYAWWGFNLWIPAYLSLPPSEGGIGLSATVMSAMVVLMQVGMWFGYVTFGFVSDQVGRKRTYIAYLLSAAVLMTAYATTRVPIVLAMLGPFVAFFGTGYFSGFGTITAEIYPTDIRAWAQGFTYNIGRLASAFAPFIVGTLAQARGFDVALTTAAVAFVGAAIVWVWIPETRGRALV